MRTDFDCEGQTRTVCAEDGSVGIARDLLRRGWTPLPIPLRKKKPVLKNWQRWRVSESELPRHFDGKQQNVGVLLGDSSSGLIDVDLDCTEALTLVDHFLPATQSKFGRKSKPRSHWLYVVSPAPRTRRFKDVDGITMLEIRGTGSQTVFPGSVHPSGEAVEWDDDGAPNEIDTDALDAGVRFLAVAAVLARHWPEKGSRHQAALALAGGLLRSRRLPPDEVGQFIQVVADAGGSEPDHDHAEVAASTLARLSRGDEATGWSTLAGLLTGDGEKVVKKVREWLRDDDRGEVSVDVEDASGRPLPRTEYGNALRLVGKFGDRFRYCHNWGKWLVWDGKRWAVDEDGAIYRAAKDTVATIVDEAKEAFDPEAQESLSKWWISSQSERRICAMISLARSEKPVAITSGELDTDLWLFNCENGTVDLRTGMLRAHDRSDLITKLAPVRYDPTAESDRFRSFLSEIMDGNESLIAYIQQLHGLYLTGDISEQILPIYWGEGGNGKNVLLDTACNLMGDYAVPAPPTLLMVRTHQEHPTEIADLAGRRLVVASETEEGGRLRIQLVKQLTGDETLKGRYMRQDYFSFRRTFKTVLVTNNKPRIREATAAIWRRIRMIPFTVCIPLEKQDRKLTEKLRDEWPGILRFFVEGAVAFHRSGSLATPEIVVQATKQYRGEQDVVQAFI